MEDDKKSKIEDIKERLYDRNDKSPEHHFEGKLHELNYKVSNQWQEDKPIINQDQYSMRKPKTSIFKIFFIFSIVFFIGSLGFAFYKFQSNDVTFSNEKIEINVLGNSFTKGGDDLSLDIEIINRNNANIELANLMISYPSGAGDDMNEIVRLPRDTIGMIKGGERVIRSIKIKLFGEEKSVRDVFISLEYHQEGSNAILTKNENFKVTINSAPISLYVTAKETSTNEQIFSFEVKAVLNTSLPEDKITSLQISYPPNFVFESATPLPSFGDSVWNLSALSLTNPITIKVTGRLIGEEGEEKVFRAYVGEINKKDQSTIGIVYNSLLHKVLIEKPFLEAKILVNGQDSPFYSVSAGENISSEVSWINNLSTRITDAEIIVNLSGNVLDWSSVDGGDGFYDSINKQIVWDKNMVSDLGSIEPGGKGSVSFKFKSTSLIGLNNQLKDPEIKLDVSIKGRQPNLGSTFTDVNNFSTKIIKLLSNFQIVSTAVYKEGALPPKAEKETKYIVTWTLSNTSNTITEAKAKSLLPIYVKWGESLTGGNEKISYNDVTREVTWDIGTVNPNTGFNSNREASFIIVLKPSMSQVGSVPQLMKEVNLSGKDSFTEVIINKTAGSITTLLPNDPNYKSGNQRVIQ